MLDDSSDPNPRQALEFYRQMFLIRTVESRLLELFAAGRIHGTIHTCLGQEACAVGLMDGIDRQQDMVFGNHRSHGHFIAYCDDVEGLIAEIMGLRSGVCGGIGGSQHLYKRNLYTNGVQGGMVPAAVGAALAEKLKGTASIAVSLLGDGTMGQGIVYECLNLAALYRAPVLFVLEDNQIAQSTPRARAHAGELSRRAEPFGIESRCVSGDNPFEVALAVRQARAFIRTEQRPFFLTLNTCRLGPHSKGDDTRTTEELARIRTRDPLPILADRIPEAERRAVEEQVNHRVRQAVQGAIDRAGLHQEPEMNSK